MSEVQGCRQPRTIQTSVKNIFPSSKSGPQGWSRMSPRPPILKRKRRSYSTLTLKGKRRSQTNPILKRRRSHIPLILRKKRSRSPPLFCKERGVVVLPTLKRKRRNTASVRRENILNGWRSSQ
nr:serine/arginine repetitive matrix protein 2-like [Nerophis lumbriciformis]